MKKQRGQSMVEFAVVLIPTMFLILATIQFILIYQAKITLNYATFEAARAGSLENASRKAVDNGFTRGFAPYFARFGTTMEKDPATKNYSALSDKVTSARKIVRKEIDDGFVKIKLLNPTTAMFNQFSSNNNTIPNDHLGFRKPVNGVNLQDANLLKIRVIYCMKLIVPMVNSFITSVAGGNCSASKENRFPIVSQTILRMQSPAIKCNGSPCFD